MSPALQRLGGLKVGEMPGSMKAFGIAGGIGSLFASHPPIEARIQALAKGAKVLPGRRFSARTSEGELKAWIDSL